MRRQVREDERNDDENDAAEQEGRVVEKSEAVARQVDVAVEVGHPGSNRWFIQSRSVVQQHREAKHRIRNDDGSRPQLLENVNQRLVEVCVPQANSEDDPHLEVSDGHGLDNAVEEDLSNHVVELGSQLLLEPGHYPVADKEHDGYE